MVGCQGLVQLGSLLNARLLDPVMTIFSIWIWDIIVLEYSATPAGYKLLVLNTREAGDINISKLNVLTNLTFVLKSDLNKRFVFHFLFVCVFFSNMLVTILRQQKLERNEITKCQSKFFFLSNALLFSFVNTCRTDQQGGRERGREIFLRNLIGYL